MGVGSIVRPALFSLLLVWTALADICRAGAADALLGRPVRAVRIEADAPVDQRELLALLPFTVGEPLEPDSLTRARQLLELKQIFERVAIETIPADDGVIVLVRVARKPIIDSVEVIGNETLSNREVRRLVRLESGMILERELVDAAVQRVESHYRKAGFVDVEVRDRIETRGGEADVDIRIREGEPLTIAAAVVDVEGAGLAAEPLEKALRYVQGTRRSDEIQREAEEELRRLVREQGFYEARIEQSWELGVGKRGVLWFDIAAGPPFEIVVRGNRAKDREELLDLMDLKERLIITDGTWRDLAERMERAYQEAGHYRADVEVTIEEREAANGRRQKQVTFEIDEGRAYSIRSVEFEGNEHISDAELLDEMVTRPPRPFPLNWLPAFRSGTLLDQTLQDDLRRLWFFYRERGFESAEILDAVKRLDENAGAIDITIIIDEGRRTVVEEVRKSGLEPLAEFMPESKVKEGEPFRADQVEEDRLALEQALGRLGYAEARVTSDVIRRTEGTGPVLTTVSYAAEPGVRREIRAIVVQGNIDTRSRAILRELDLQPGDPLDTSALLRGQANIYKLGLFRSVSVRPLAPEDALERDVGVQVVERAAGKLEWGFGYNTRDGIGTFLTASYDNLGGMARQVSMHTQVAIQPGEITPDQYLGNLGYREPRLFGSPWTFKTNLIAERSTQTVDRFSIERVAALWSSDRELLERLRGGFELQAEQADVFDVPDDAELSRLDEGDLRTIAVSPFVVWDRRDDPVSPRRGIVNSLRYRYALPELSTVHFGKISFQHAHYLPVTRHLTFVYAGRGGYAALLDDSPALPIRERFFLGGRSTVRGFSENSIGPKRRCPAGAALEECPRGVEPGEIGEPIGGDLSLNVNVELLFPIVWEIQGALFVDGGGVYVIDGPGDPTVQDDSFTLRNFRRSVGFGLRYNSPVGPVALDFGAKLDRRRDEDFGAVHFSVGSPF